MDSEQQGAGRDQAEAEAKPEARGVLISLELERRKRGLHLGGSHPRNGHPYSLEAAGLSAVTAPFPPPPSGGGNPSLLQDLS